MSDNLSHIDKIARLIIKHHEGTINEQESHELTEWCDMSECNRLLFEKLSALNFIQDEIKDLPDISALKNERWEKVITVIEAEESPAPQAVTKQRLPIRYFAAATVLLIASSIWFFAKEKTYTTPPISQAPSSYKDIAPGGNKAILTLANGSSIIIENERNGIIAHQDSARVEKKREGQLVYTVQDHTNPRIYKPSSLEKTYEDPTVYSRESPPPNKMAYNILTIPKGGQFQVILSDGSKVWLNNASSLRYPVTFSGDQREVELIEGEAYFEITPKVHQPFKVKLGKMSVGVLGTSFNISAYANENRIQTTLLTGGVRVFLDSTQTVLKPGEQAQVTREGLKKIKLNYAQGAVAWKNGIFHFEKADIRTVMEALARWYDLDVVYEGAVTEDQQFDGEFPRNQYLSHAINILEDHDLHLRLEGRKIIVRTNR